MKGKTPLSIPPISGRTGRDEAASKSDRQVNSLLHTLRGEHFRHSQNISGTKLRISNASSYSKPSLPLSQIFGASGDDAVDMDIQPVQPAPFRAPGEEGHARRARPPITLIEGVPTYAYPDGPVPGPRPPKSWSALFDHEEKNTPSWRASALSLIFADLPLATELMARGDSQPLTRICMRVLLAASSTPAELAQYAQYVPPHLRRDLIRWCAIHQPLPTAKLYALCADEGHADGELVVIGPEAGLRIDKLRRMRHIESIPAMCEDVDWNEDDEAMAEDVDEKIQDWDDSTDTSPPIVSLVLLRTDLLIPTALPPTLTHLALLALQHPTRVHHLPPVCPLLEVLDLSFNPWLSNKESSPHTEGTLERVEWNRWRRLRVLGLRECQVAMTQVARVNRGRWTSQGSEVEIVGVEEDAL